MTKRVYAALVLALLSTRGLAQEFYTPMPQSLMFDPIQGDDPFLFNVNPSSNATTGFKGGTYGLRQFRDTTLTADDDSDTITRSRAKQDVYAGQVMVDLGAGMSASIAAERSFTESKTSRTTATRTVRELMLQQTLTGRVEIDLAPGFRSGFIMRYVSLSGDLAGAFNASDAYRVRYHGNMLGNGAGFTFVSGGLAAEMSYFPAVRGKSEIMFEERIITDPGMATAGLSYKAGPHTFGLALQRWVHKRDERAATVTSPDGQRTLTLNGLDPEKNVLPVAAYHLGLEFGLGAGRAVRASVAKKDSVWTTDAQTAPTTVSGYESLSELDQQLAVRLNFGRHDILVGANKFGRSKTLSSLAGSNQGDRYEAYGYNMFATWGGKL
jgi:hypothetical protein